MEFPKKSWGALRAQEMALELVSLESASDYAKWMGSSTSPQVQMAQSYESACWPLARVNRTACLLPGALSNFLQTDLPVALLIGKARNRAS